VSADGIWQRRSFTETTTSTGRSAATGLPLAVAAASKGPRHRGRIVDVGRRTTCLPQVSSRSLRRRATSAAGIRQTTSHCAGPECVRQDASETRLQGNYNVLYLSSSSSSKQAMWRHSFIQQPKPSLISVNKTASVIEIYHISLACLFTPIQVI